MYELNRTWWLSKLNTKSLIWDLYGKISRISGNNVLEILHYSNDTWLVCLAYILKEALVIIIYMRMPGPTRTSDNTRITMNDEPVDKLPIALLPYSLGLGGDITLFLRSIGTYD